MRRDLLRKIHLWLSLPLGIFITLICLSGASVVFKSEIRDALGMPRVIAHAGKHEAAKDGKRTAVMKKAGHKQVDKYGTTTKPDFFSYMTRFHKSLMMGTAGKWIVTIVTIFLLLILISGAWECWPKNGRQWRQRLSIETGKGSRRLMYGLHVALGWWILLWLAALAVTGAAFGLHLLPKGSAWMTVFHAIHVGTWGGIVSKVLTFIVSLVGASLPITGYWLYFKRKAAKRH